MFTRANHASERGFSGPCGQFNRSLCDVTIHGAVPPA
jgi:hypothetical protein